MQDYARNRQAEKRADPEWHAEYEKKQRRYYRTKGKFLPNRKLSRQRAYSKLPPIGNGVSVDSWLPCESEANHVPWRPVGGPTDRRH
jgi:hypothetical protein